MKKSVSKTTALALVLAMTCALPLQGCKKNKKDSSGAGPNNGANSGRPTEVKEDDPYFSDSTVSFQVPVDTERTVEGTHLNKSCLSNDKVYYMYEVTYRPTEEQQKLLDNYDPYDADQLRQYFEIAAGTSQRGIRRSSLSGEVELDYKLDPDADPINMFFLSDGTMGVFETKTTYDVDDMGELIQYDTMKLVYYSADGSVLEEHEITDDDMHLIGYSNVKALADGNLLFYGETEILVTDRTGKLLARNESEDAYRYFFTDNGKTYAVISSFVKKGEDDYAWENSVCEFDTNTLTPGSKTALTDLATELFECGEKGTYGMSEEGIVKSDILNNKEELVMSFSDTDFSMNSGASDLSCTEDNDFYILYDYIQGDGPDAQTELRLTHFHKEEKNPYAGKKIIYAASCGTAPEGFFRSVINEYNKRPESKARVLVYVEPSDTGIPYQEQAANAADKMLLAMKSGNGPDVLLDCADFSQFNSDKILVDLNPYMDGENGIDRSKYFDNIFRAFETDGKLYQMPLLVTVSGLVGDKSVLGDKDGFTLSEMDEKLSLLPSDVFPMTYQPKDILTNLLYADMDHYVNYSAGTANFDSDDFRNLLEFSKKFGGRISEEKYYELCERYDLQSMISDLTADCFMMQDGLVSLCSLDLSEIRYYASYAELCGRDPLLLGWPTSKEPGLCAQASVSVGISAFSDNADESWDFVSFLLQSEDNFSFWGDIYVLRSGAEKLMQNAIDEYSRLTEIYKDAPGMYEGQAPLSDATIASYEDVIGRVRSSVHTNPSIMAIVEEEAAAFFNGQKSADEVSKTIQNRVSTLMSEQQ